MALLRCSYWWESLKSRYCWLVMLLGFGLGDWLVPSLAIKHAPFLALVFIFFFALTLMCLARNIKERFLLARTYKGSFLSVLAIGIGLGALQSCALSAPVCGASVGMGFFSFLFPLTFTNFLYRYIRLFLLFSILLQLISLYFMNCFKNSCWRQAKQ